MKYFYLFVVLLCSTYAFGQNYNNIVNYAASTAPVHGVKIKTNLPFTPLSQMPTINITGYNYGTGQTINLTLVYYIYSGGTDFYDPANFYFNSPSISSAGGYTPKVFLSAENGKVVIFIDDKSYYQRFTVSAYAVGLSEVAASFEGWSAADEALNGMATKEVPYKNSFKGDVNLPGNGIWNSNGDVGIGNSSPKEKLDVSGNVVWNGYNTGNPRAAKLGFSGGNYGGIGYNLDFTQSNGIFNRPLMDQSSYLEFTNGGFRFYGTSHGANANEINLTGGGANLNLFATMTNTGNFGVGTSDPVAKLDVNGHVMARGNVIASMAGIDIGGAIEIQNPAKTENGAANTWRIYNMSGAYGNSLQFWAYDHLGCATGLCHNRFTLLDNGNVGIGTVNPEEKLTVAGKIAAREIKVTTNAGADFVFEPDYQLPALNELERFVKTNKHLPEIPTAQQMIKDGVNLGELNIKLLQKVEELTLHLIEKDKELNKQHKQVAELESKLTQQDTILKQILNKLK